MFHKGCGARQRVTVHNMDMFGVQSLDKFSTAARVEYKFGSTTPKLWQDRKGQFASQCLLRMFCSIQDLTSRNDAVFYLGTGVFRSYSRTRTVVTVNLRRLSSRRRKRHLLCSWFLVRTSEVLVLVLVQYSTLNSHWMSTALAVLWLFLH